MSNKTYKLVKCIDCGKIKEASLNANTRNFRCSTCREIHRKNREKEYKEKLRKIKYWEGPFHCEICGKEFEEDWRTDPKTKKESPPRFCSKECSNHRFRSQESKEKTSATLIKHFLKENNVEFDNTADLKILRQLSNRISGKKESYRRKGPKSLKFYEEYTCTQCGKKYKNIRSRENCRVYKNICRECAFAAGGRISASAREDQKVSKSEVYFRHLCENEGWEVLHNEAIFNGFDSDIILPEFNLAIHWNGPWHYEGLIKNHKRYSYDQVHNRDLIKYKEIEKCGYKNYIIKYIEKFSEKKIKEEFDKFKDYLKDNQLII